MVAYLYRMPAGIAGDINRAGAGNTVETQVIAHTGQPGSPQEFGIPVSIDATTGLIRAAITGDTGTVPGVYGLLVRAYPTNASQEGLGVAKPLTVQGSPCDVLRRGYMTVKCHFGTPQKNKPVYVWTAAPSGQHVTGGIEATDPTTSGFAVPGCVFMGAADADGNVEVAFNI